MTNPPASPTTASVTASIRIPASAIVLLVAGLALLPIGALTMLGTASREFFENAPTQAALGAIMLVTGFISLTGALVVVGVRSIAQQHLALTAAACD